MLTDIHPELGPKVRMRSIEECDDYMRQVWGIVRMEGSSGMQRSYWTGPVADDAELVGHCWEMRGPTREWWVRRKVKA